MPVPPHELRQLPLEEVMALAPSAVHQAFAPSAYFFDDPPAPYDRVGSVAVVTVEGPLVQRGGWWFDGYDSIAARFGAALADKSVTGVVLQINSPGGSCAGCFEATRAMRAAADEAGKPVVAFADEMAFSAAYALACVADQVVLPRAGGVGSVGVIASVFDRTKMTSAAGLNVAVLTSGDQKADGHPDVPLAKDALGRLQARVDQLATMFAEWVGARRGMSASAVLGLEAACLYGEDAVRAGLADRIGTLGDAVQMASAAAQTKGNKVMLKALLAALGLPENTTEAEALAALAAHQNTERSVLALTGQTRAAEALGVLTAWKASHARVEQLAADLAALEAKAKADKVAAEIAERKSLLDGAVAEGKMTPAERASYDSDPDLAALPLAAVRASVRSRIAVVKREPAAAGAGAPEPGAAVALTPEDEHVMRLTGVSAADFLASKKRLVAAGEISVG